MNGFQRKVYAALISITILSLSWPAQSGPQTTRNPDLYQASTIVTGRRDMTRIPGIEECFRIVMVKSSGNPKILDDPKVAGFASKASDFVDDFHYHDRMSGIPVHDEQGSRDRPYDLTVDFSAKSIDVILNQLKSRVWTERPKIVAFIAVDFQSNSFLLANDERLGIDQRDALMASASRIGIPLLIPSSEIFDKANLDVGSLSKVTRTTLVNAAKTEGGQAALIGQLVWNEEKLAWSANWRLYAKNANYRWKIDGVNFDGAYRDAIGNTAQILSGNIERDSDVQALP